jgi:hypothetical protein
LAKLSLQVEHEYVVQVELISLLPTNESSEVCPLLNGLVGWAKEVSREEEVVPFEKRCISDSFSSHRSEALHAELRDGW